MKTADPYLWLHVSALAALPLLLEVCLLGFAASDPLLIGGLDWLFVGLLGAAPILAVQWTRPFYPFGVAGVVSLRPASLDEQRLKLLRRLKGWPSGAIALGGTFVALLVLQQLYGLGAIAAEVTPFGNRAVGLIVAAIAFLLANLVWQLGLSALWLGQVGEGAAIDPYPLGDIPANFTRWGIPLTRILSDLAPPPAPEVVTPPVAEQPETVEAGSADAAAVSTEITATPTPEGVEPVDQVVPEVAADLAPTEVVSEESTELIRPEVTEEVTETVSFDRPESAIERAPEVELEALVQALRSDIDPPVAAEPEGDVIAPPPEPEVAPSPEPEGEAIATASESQEEAITPEPDAH